MEPCSSLVELFQALGDPTRLRIVNLLSAGELCVCYLVEILGDPQPKISRHLAYLRRTGVVAARRDGKWIHYSIARPSDEGERRVLDAALEVIRKSRPMMRERLMLERACCAPTPPPGLANAPKPVL